MDNSHIWRQRVFQQLQETSNSRPCNIQRLLIQIDPMGFAVELDKDVVEQLEEALGIACLLVKRYLQGPEVEERKDLRTNVRRYLCTLGFRAEIRARATIDDEVVSRSNAPG
jgi:hypothetical protein